MFDFFLALFGGAYFAGKFMSNKYTTSELDRISEQRKNRINEYHKKYEASDSLSQQLKKDIFSGEKYDIITTKFSKDFEFVFGDNWKSVLAIPPVVQFDDSHKRKFSDYFCIGSTPTYHMDWVYHLMLADCGKINSLVMSTGYRIGGYGGYEYERENTEMCIKFAQCVERRLLDAGVDVHFGLEIEGSRYARNEDTGALTGRRLKIQELSIYDTLRLW